MEKVLKVNVYLNDLKDYKAMNDAFSAASARAPSGRRSRRRRDPGQLPRRDRLHRDALAAQRAAGARSGLR